MSFANVHDVLRHLVTTGHFRSDAEREAALDAVNASDPDREAETREKEEAVQAEADAAAAKSAANTAEYQEFLAWKNSQKQAVEPEPKV